MCRLGRSGKTVKNILGNQDGFVIGLIIFVFALFGAWFLVQSFLQGQLQNNIKNVANDYMTVFSRK